MLRLNFMLYMLVLLCSLLLSGCGESESQSHYPAIKNLQLERYLGKWYEIARLENAFEQGLNNVSVDYSIDEADRIRFKVQSLLAAADEWQLKSGILNFVSDEHIGQFTLSLGKTTNTDYTILYVDSDYQYALVTAGQGNYLWIMSRAPTLEPSISRILINKARGLGFPVNKLVFIDQNRPNR